MNTQIERTFLILALTLLAACSTSKHTMKTVENLDIERFMGDWCVIANIPTYFEANAFNPVERYRLGKKGRIETTFAFNAGAIDGPYREMNATGFVRDPVNHSIWGMQFVWPFEADYRVVYVDANYQYAIVGRNKRDYLWIMARNQPVTTEQLNSLMTLAVQAGYRREDILLTNWQDQHKCEAG